MGDKSSPVSTEEKAALLKGCRELTKNSFEKYGNMADTDLIGWRLLSAEGMCELEGPYECHSCGGHIMLDATFLDQVSESVPCPYCDYKGANDYTEKAAHDAESQAATSRS